MPDHFDLILQAEVGGVLGNSGANYTLTFAAINDDMVTRQVSLNPPGNPFPEEWSPGDGWIRSGNDFVKTGRARPTASCATGLTSPPALPAPSATTCAWSRDNFQVTSFARSNPFLLV